MSYSEHWQELFGPTGDGGAMRLASAPPHAGADAGGTGGLQHSKGPWTSASGTADELRTRTEASRSALGRGCEGIETGTAGLSSVAALRSVLTSWEERLQAVRDECDQLTGNLLKVAKDMGETETGVKASFAGAHASGKADERR
ncbi:hypothetical protein [Streptomyces sp. NPDC049916]|uniref:hypothetical protein n=1 Tax=Streptomyces sp. NPDC049916 TaxID=3155156 RepID=UPI0034407852